MGRDFRLYCVDVDGDGSEFNLVFEMNCDIVESKESLWSFDDVLLEVHSFYNSCCNKYNYDSRFDTLEVSINN